MRLMSFGSKSGLAIFKSASHARLLRISVRVTMSVIGSIGDTHKKNEHWLKAHPNVQFHFTPTSASWLNQVEVWFSILQGQSLSGTSFTSLKQLQEHIDAYVNAYNDKAEPFVWTKKFQRPPYH